jgi:hypothetical protein
MVPLQLFTFLKGTQMLLQILQGLKARENPSVYF